MTLLIDTDAFWKLGLANLLSEASLLLGFELGDCARLPALPYMLQRGSLFKRLGQENCAKLLSLANSLPSIPEPTGSWLETLTPVNAIDPGEARLYAAAAESGFMVLTDDKRSMKELKKVQGITQILKGKVAGLEGILLALCRTLGSGEVRARISALTAFDTMLSICFSVNNNDVMECLSSYYKTLATEVDPLVLWSPVPEFTK
jgi:hypothetical protein